MRKDLLTLQGDCLKFFPPEAGIPLAMVTGALNDAVQTVYVDLQEIEHSPSDEMLFTDLIADKDVYDVPEVVGSLHELARMDMGAAAIPLERIDSEEMAAAEVTNGATYAEVPGGRIRLISKPSTGQTDGLRWTFLPEAKPMANDTDYPSLPSGTADALVARAVEQLAATASLTDSRRFDQWHARQESNLMRVLVPDNHDGMEDLADIGGRYIPLNKSRMRVITTRENLP